MDMPDLTLVFFVRDRQFNIGKLIEYYSSLNCRKIIYDSSTKPIKNEVISKLKSKNIEYVWLDAVPFLVAKNLAFSDVKTEYVMDCPDDDLFIIPSIQKALKILRDNPDYVSCQGHEHWCDSINKQLYGINDPTSFSFYENLDLIKDTVTRVKAEIQYFVGYAHALHRTKFHLENNRFLLENMEYRSGVWEEIIPGILSAIHGNRKIIPDLWVLRHRTKAVSGSPHNLDRICACLEDDTFYYGTKTQDLSEENLSPICVRLSQAANIDQKKSFEIIKSTLEENDKNAARRTKPIISAKDYPELYHLVDLMDSTADFYQ